MTPEQRQRQRRTFLIALGTQLDQYGTWGKVPGSTKQKLRARARELGLDLADYDLESHLTPAERKAALTTEKQ